MKLVFVCSLTLIVLALSGCTQPDKKAIGEMLKKHPEILTDAIKENPEKFITALNEAVKIAQAGEREKREEEEKKKFEDSFKEPLVPEIRSDEVIRGDKSAPLTLVEYSDFECPFCKRGFETVNALLEKYDGKIRFIYKHLPLRFHPNAMPAAKYYEAIRLQSPEKAIKFHDNIFKNFEKIKLGEKFFKSLAKDLSVDMSKLAKDIDSAEVNKRIQEDLAEAKKFGFQGTPGFLLNGIPVKGAYPPSHFDMIVEELKKRGKITL